MMPFFVLFLVYSLLVFRFLFLASFVMCISFTKKRDETKIDIFVLASLFNRCAQFLQSCLYDWSWLIHFFLIHNLSRLVKLQYLCKGNQLIFSGKRVKVRGNLMPWNCFWQLNFMYYIEYCIYGNSNSLFVDGITKP